VAVLDKAAVARVLEPHWLTRKASMMKLREHISCIVAYAVSKGYRPEGLADPAAWKGGLKPLLADPRKFSKTVHCPALLYARMAEFMTILRQDSRLAARAMELVILTATRTNEARLSTWEEIDLQAATWTIPPERMKSERGHRIPLSEAACAVLRAIKGDNPNPTGLVFRGAVGEKALMRMAHHVAAKMRPPVAKTDLTTHGMRSAFRTWGAQATNFQREILQVALAHKVGSETENAYQHGDLFAKRAKAMEAWARYLGTTNLRVA
jgi:integrase